MAMKNVVILGSTGSIGAQTLDVIARLPDRIRVIALAANRNARLLAQQAERFGVRNLALIQPDAAAEMRQLRPNSVLVTGLEGISEIAALPEADLVVVAVAGAIGIRPTHAAIGAGKDIALASKEVLVAAGEATMALAKERGVRILPIDSEHSALFQCLQGAPEKSVEKLILTASGGPFRNASLAELEHVTPEQALKHPTWNMGGLVTINSATLMNKGLEIIEARWLFDVPADSVEVLTHPQSIVHSLVRFRDGSVLAQLGLPDMRLPIQYALVYPERVDTGLPTMDLAGIGALTFENADSTRFPALRIAREAERAGGTMPAVMNAANEAAVELFLQRRIPFAGIMKCVETTMALHAVMDSTYENVLATDQWARETVRALL
jgi:1-deoxy-D-xylulose-5-phosphate reductoisomerase